MSAQKESGSKRPLLRAALAGLAFMTVGAGVQALFAPTVIIACARRPSGEPSCRLQWRVILDAIPVRYQVLEGVRGVRVAETYEGSPGRSGSGGRRLGVKPYKLMVDTSRGPVRAVLWGDEMELRELRDPVATFLENPDHDAMRVALPARLAVYRWVGLGLFAFGALYWLYLPFQARALRSK